MPSNYFPSLYQEMIHLSRYSRWLPEENRRETWVETVDRYFNFFDEHLRENNKFNLDLSTRNELREAVLNLEIMPSMRCLMAAGEALKRENVAGYNCSYISVDNPRAFDEILYILMNGCFHPDTLIKTSDGDKKITDITPNDKVLSYDTTKKIFEWISPEWVIPTPHSIEKNKMCLEFEDGTSVTCTEDHEFYTTNRGWVKAKDLSEDDDIKNYHEI